MTREDETNLIITENVQSEKHRMRCNVKIAIWLLLFSALVLQLYILIKAVLWRYILILTV
jgi:hypothetical protein